MEAASILSAMKGEKLKDSPQWLTWFAKVQLYAMQKNVWDLCNPDPPTTAESQTIRSIPLQEPIEPEYPEDGDDKDRSIWRDRLDVYKMKYTKWEKQAEGLSDVNEYILTYLDSMHHLALITYRTPYDRLVYLKARFARSTAYEEEIRMSWKVFAMQKPTGDIEQWLQKWNSPSEAIQISKHALSATKTSEISLHNRWILNTGSSSHYRTGARERQSSTSRQASTERKNGDHIE
ncbi:unnamed protein product [Penicillium discolor]